jgi:YVTN family beta-propeller protein
MHMKKILYLLVCLAALSGRAQNANMWNHKQCAVALTYDDAIDGDLDNVLPALDSLGLKGTFYLIGSSPVVASRMKEWREAALHGHELGNHALYHPCDGSLPGRSFVQADHDLSKYTVSRAVSEIRMNNVLLNAIDGRTKRTFAYPCGDLKIGDSFFYAGLRKDFVAARGVRPAMDPIEKVNLDNVDCYSMNGQTADQMIALVKEAIRTRTLLVFLFHGVGGGHSINVGLKEHSVLLHFLKDHEQEIWIAPMVEVAEYIRGRQEQRPESSAQSASGRTLLALSKTDHMLAMVDPATLKVIARIPVGIDPHEVIASSDGKTAFVSIYGGGSLHELNVIDLVAQKPLLNIDTRPLLGPHGLTFADGKAWFTAEGSKSIGRYDPVTGKLDWSMGTGQDRTHMIYVTADGKKIYTTNVSSGTVSILTNTLIQPGRSAPPGAKPREDWASTIIPVARGSEGFDVSPDGRQLWTAASEDGTIFIIDLEAKKLASKIDAKVLGANRLKFTPDGKLVFISSLGTGDLSIYDAQTQKETKRLKIGHGAAGILMDPEGSRAFVACSADNYIAVIDLKTLEVTGRIEVGGVPDGLAWAVRP